ncbi:large conductance mechanosensitive channel protein, partial [Ramicandelaber brevisporus]
WTDFTDFVGKGNVVQTAIAFIVGGAFSTIVESLVNDLLMPPLGLLTGANFADHFMVLQYEQPGKNNDEYDTLAEAIADGAVCIKYGLFAQKLFDFLTIALVLFLVIRTFQKLARAAVDLHERPCPECLSEIPDRAKRCRFCAS